MKQQVCVGGLILKKSGEFLVVKRSDTDDYMASMWELPGGGTDDGETPQDALLREVTEEVGLNVTVGKPLGVHVYFMEKDTEKIQRVEITFLCSLDEAKEVVLSFEHADYAWIAQDKAENFDFSDYMKQVVKDSLANL